MDRRKLVGMLKQAGYFPDGGTKHERFKKDQTVVFVPRHHEIPEFIAQAILKQAGVIQ